jgi:hypothetical protein
MSKNATRLRNHSTGEYVIFNEAGALVNQDGDSVGGSGGTLETPTAIAFADTDGTIIGSEQLEWDDAASILKLGDAANGSVAIQAVGAGVQVAIAAADGDATHVGGELSLNSGASNGQSGGQINIVAGDDDGGGDGGNVVISSGNATDVGSGGESGDIEIRCGGGGSSDGDGGRVLITGGGSTDGDGGGVQITGGSSVNGTPGWVAMNSPDVNSGLYADNDGVSISGKLAFYGGTPVVKPTVPLTTPSVQDIIDALVLLRLIAQSD